jgi:hypothetical protein
MADITVFSDCAGLAVSKTSPRRCSADPAVILVATRSAERLGSRRR